ncbi:hypothetical protein [Fictibacillus macauensis]|nr:hypothetical protein [Fictibacillus macauensis]
MNKQNKTMEIGEEFGMYMPVVERDRHQGKNEPQKQKEKQEKEAKS